jgi:hypothetical protein
MVTKKKSKGRVKVGTLKLNKETVKNLSSAGAKKVKGGLRAAPPSDPNENQCTAWCARN